MQSQNLDAQQKDKLKAIDENYAEISFKPDGTIIEKQTKTSLHFFSTL
jgi:lactam utilization protein B